MALAALATALVALVALILAFLAGREVGRGESAQTRVSLKETAAKAKGLERQIEAAEVAAREVASKLPQALAHELEESVLRKLRKRGTMY